MKREFRTCLLLAMFVATVPTISFAQLVAAKDGPVVYGHHHLNVTSVEDHQKFWVDTLGGVPAKLGPMDIVKFPNVFMIFTPMPPLGGTKGSSVNHVGFQVPNLRTTLDLVKEAGYPIVTREELPPSYQPFEKDGIAVIEDQDTVVAFVMAPDDTKVELFEVKEMEGSIGLHHIHFAAPDVVEMQAWYAKVFGAKPGKRGVFDAAALPGVSLTFSPASAPSTSDDREGREVVLGVNTGDRQLGIFGQGATKGRALDHIGFEVQNLEAFTKQLEEMGIPFDLPYTAIPTLDLGIAFLTDPWGTYIELTEGLDEIQ